MNRKLTLIVLAALVISPLNADARLKKLAGFYYKILGTKDKSPAPSGTAFYVADVSPDERYIVGGDVDGSVRLWDLKSGSTAYQLVGRSRGGILGIGFLAGGSLIVSAGERGDLIIWDRAKKTYKISRKHKSGLLALAVAPDGKTFLSGGQEGRIYRWAADGKFLGNAGRHTKGIHSLSYHPGGNSWISAGHEGDIKIWSKDGRLLTKIPGNGRPVSNAVFSPDGKHIAVLIDIYSRDTYVRLMTVRGQPVRTIDKVGGFGGCRSRGASFDSTGRYLVMGTRACTTYVYDLKKGTKCYFEEKLAGDPKDGKGSGMERFSPRGNYIVSARNNSTIVLWDFARVRKYCETNSKPMGE